MRIHPHFFVTFVACLLPVLVAGCGGGGGPATATVTGRVLEATDGAAVPAATVRIGGISGATDAGGAFQLAGVPAGEQPLTVSASGYTLVGAPLKVQITPGRTNLAAIVLVPSEGGMAPPGAPW